MIVNILIDCRQRGEDCKLRLRKKGEWRERAGFLIENCFLVPHHFFERLGSRPETYEDQVRWILVAGDWKIQKGQKGEWSLKKKQPGGIYCFPQHFTWQAMGKLRPLFLHFTWFSNFQRCWNYTRRRGNAVAGAENRFDSICRYFGIFIPSFDTWTLLSTCFQVSWAWDKDGLPFLSCTNLLATPSQYVVFLVWLKKSLYMSHSNSTVNFTPTELMLQNHPSVKKHKKQMENICNKSYVIKYAQDYICNNKYAWNLSDELNTDNNFSK